MGGAFGHLSHPFEDRDLKFSDFKKIITQGLSGKLDRVQEKLDGMNIMISWKDNRLVSAELKNNSLMLSRCSNNTGNKVEVQG